MEVYRGGYETEAGICFGGTWKTKTGVVTDVFPSGYDGFVEFYDGDYQSADLIAGVPGFPGKNIRLAE